MNYKDYTITAEVETYEQWTLNDDGSLGEWLDDNDTTDITGYLITNDNDPADTEFITTSECDVETLHDLVDSHIADLTRKAEA